MGFFNVLSGVGSEFEDNWWYLGSPNLLKKLKIFGAEKNSVEIRILRLPFILISLQLNIVLG
jgi:hypothetical protein